MSVGAWGVISGVFIIMMTNAGLAFYGTAVYLDAVTRQRGWSTSAVSVATSLFFIASGLTGHLAGTLMRRFDMRVIIAIGGTIAAAALTLMPRATSTVGLLGVYLLFGVGAGCTGLVPTTTLVTRWFTDRRALGLAVASTGLSVGGLVLTRYSAWLISSRGLTSAMPLVGATYLGLILVALPLVPPWPTTRPAAAVGPAPPAVDRVRVQRLVRSRFFVIYTAAYVLLLGMQTGGIAQLAKLGAERITPEVGTTLVSAVAVTSVIARFAGGAAAARADLLRLTIGLGGLQVIALVVLGLSMTTPWLIAGAIAFGATVGNILMLQPLVIASVTPVDDYPRVFSTNQLFVAVGQASGPALLGVLHDSADYRVAYLGGAAASVGGLALVIVAQQFRPHFRS